MYAVKDIRVEAAFFDWLEGFHAAILFLYSFIFQYILLIKNSWKTKTADTSSRCGSADYKIPLLLSENYTCNLCLFSFTYTSILSWMKGIFLNLVLHDIHLLQLMKSLMYVIILFIKQSVAALLPYKNIYCNRKWQLDSLCCVCAYAYISGGPRFTGSHFYVSTLGSYLKKHCTGKKTTRASTADLLYHFENVSCLDVLLYLYL